MITRHCPSVLNTKKKSTRFAGAKQRSLLPHIFAVFGVVCGGNSNSNENSGKCGISQDVHVAPPVQTAARPTSSRCTNGRFGKMKQQRTLAL